MLNREEAIKWCNENVAVWPTEFGQLKPTPPDGWRWDSTGPTGHVLESSAGVIIQRDWKWVESKFKTALVAMTPHLVERGSDITITQLSEIVGLMEELELLA